MQPTVRILGTRGVPAAHGGFETAAEHIGLELVRRGWRVIVYCQTDRQHGWEDSWRGIERVHFPGKFAGAWGTIWFDMQSVKHAARHKDLCLTFGYNTGFLNAAFRAKGIDNVINMDGLEWKRAGWSKPKKAFLYANERIACRAGNHLIADHPEILKHLATRVDEEKITMIPYGAPAVDSASEHHLEALGLEKQAYLTLIARPVIENSIEEIVNAFTRTQRDLKLLVLGNYHPDENDYHRRVLDAADETVVFPGAIYDPEVVSALRFHSLGYVHGHTVGGTNPSLVEALGCGNAVIAHDNPYNRWVAGDAALYFKDTEECVTALDRFQKEPELVNSLSAHATERHRDAFTWSRITDAYERVLLAHL